MHLLDINVWLGLSFQAHVHHASALAWFRSSGSAPCHFCRVTQMGFLRLASNPQAMGAAAVTLDDAWRAYDLLSADPRIEYVEEPDGVEPIWRSHTQRQHFSPKVWNDAYLAAFAEVGEFDLVTFDQGFSRYHSIRRTLLT